MPTLSLYPYGSSSSTSLEKVSKPTVRSVLILNRAPAQAPDELQEAEIRWGKPSEFDISGTNPRDTTDGTSVRVVTRNPDEEPQEELADLLLEWNEIARKTHDFVVTAEGGGDLSVTVRRIDQIDFLAPQAFVQIVAKATGVTFNRIISRYILSWDEDESQQ